MVRECSRTFKNILFAKSFTSYKSASKIVLFKKSERFLTADRLQPKMTKMRREMEEGGHHYADGNPLGGANLPRTPARWDHAGRHVGSNDSTVAERQGAVKLAGSLNPLELGGLSTLVAQ